MVRRQGAPQVAVHLSGQTPSFLLVHGATATASTWATVMPALTSLGVQSAAIDLRGHGRSEGAAELHKASIHDYVSDVLAVLKSMPSIRVIAGHSMGGLICQFVAAQFEVERMILVASSPVDGMRRNGMRMAIRHPWTFLRVGATRSFRNLYQSERVTQSLLFHPSSPRTLVRRFMAECQEESWVAGNQMNTLLPDPRRVRCPASVIAGSDDFMVDRHSSRATADAYSTQLTVVEKCGHMVPYEADPLELAQLMLQNDA
jgi:pimeloyl-ACP methyl ester carboxylesterase